MAVRYISRKAMPSTEGRGLRAEPAAQEEELCHVYALLWQKQAALDAASIMVGELTMKLQAQQCELEMLRAIHNANSPH